MLCEQMEEDQVHHDDVSTITASAALMNQVQNLQVHDNQDTQGAPGTVSLQNVSQAMSRRHIGAYQVILHK